MVQGLDFQRVPLASTDANFFLPKFTFSDNCWVVRYGPWYEGRNTHKVMDEVLSRIPFEPKMVDVYIYNEAIEWPEEILERYAR